MKKNIRIFIFIALFLVDFVYSSEHMNNDIDLIPIIDTVIIYFYELMKIINSILFFSETKHEHFLKCLTLQKEITEACLMNNGSQVCSDKCNDFVSNYKALYNSNSILDICTFDSYILWYNNFYNTFNLVTYLRNSNLCGSDSYFEIWNYEKCIEKYFNFEDIKEDCYEWTNKYGCLPINDVCPCRIKVLNHKNMYTLKPCIKNYFSLKNDLNLKFYIVLIYFALKLQNYFYKNYKKKHNNQ